MIVDLRDSKSFERRNIEGSINIPANRVKMNLKKLQSYDKVVFACVSGTIARKMEHRYKKVLKDVSAINIVL